LKIIKATNSKIPFILVTGNVSEEFAVKIMKEGAYDYILKDSLQRLPNAVLHAMDSYTLEVERQKFLNEVIETEALKKSLKKISDFVQHASHELRTPLATMLLQTESALRKELTTEEAKKVLESLKEEQMKIIDLTNSLLLLSQFESGHYLSHWPKLRIEELLYDSIEEAKKMYPDINISFNFLKYPEEESYLYLRGNETLLHIAFSNLIKNAYLYSDNKHAIIILEAQSNVIYLHFENKGQVLKTEDKEKIFLPFRRGENAQQKKGSGLGLSIVTRIAELHKGTVNYQVVNHNINRFTLSFFTQ